MSDIAKNIFQIKNRLRNAALKAGRDPETITLVAVSKTKSLADVRAAFEAGQFVFGENYAQEMAAKAAELKDMKIEWHFIGHLQKNKAKLVAPVASWIETIDSFELATAVARRSPVPSAVEGSLVAQKIKCLIEVNVGDESSKSGCGPQDILPLARRIETLQNLDLQGLMIIPPFNPDPEFGRPYFKKLRELLSDLNGKLDRPKPFTQLSMGMSHDFEVAIEEGATIVRVGTAIFGERS